MLCGSTRSAYVHKCMVCYLCTICIWTIHVWYKMLRNQRNDTQIKTKTEEQGSGTNTTFKSLHSQKRTAKATMGLHTKQKTTKNNLTLSSACSHVFFVWFHVLLVFSSNFPKPWNLACVHLIYSCSTPPMSICASFSRTRVVNAMSPSDLNRMYPARA